MKTITREQYEIKHNKFMKKIRASIPHHIKEVANYIAVYSRNGLITVKNRYSCMPLLLNRVTISNKSFFEGNYPDYFKKDIIILKSVFPKHIQFAIEELEELKSYTIIEDRVDYDIQIENEILDLTAKLWNKFLELEQTHPSDANDLCDAVHDIQKIIAVRMARRNKPEAFVTIKDI